MEPREYEQAKDLYNTMSHVQNKGTFTDTGKLTIQFSPTEFETYKGKLLANSIPYRL